MAVCAGEYVVDARAGITPLDEQASKPWVSGFVVRELSRVSSGWRATGELDSYLVEHGISRELAEGRLEVAPSAIFIDIQPDQLEDFRARLDANAAVEKVDSAPMLRGIITDTDFVGVAINLLELAEETEPLEQEIA